MAVRTSLTWIKRRLQKAMRNLAAVEGWLPTHYEFTGTYDESTGRFSLVFGIDHPIDELDAYKKILGALQEAFAEYPSFVSRIGLVIQQVDDVEQVFQRLRIAEDEVDLGDLKNLTS